MLKRSSEIGIKFQVAAGEIISAIHAVSTQNRRTSLDRRLVKLLEELGEVSEAFLETSSSNRKGKSIDDLLEEKVDVFIVSADIMHMHGMVPGQSDDELADQLHQELSTMLLEMADTRLSSEQTPQRLSEVVQELGKAWAEASASRELTAFYLGMLHAACTRLLLTPEVTPKSEDPAELAQLMFERTYSVVGMVKAKLSKWTRTLQLHPENAATA